jgi:hypothetical protein
MKSDLLFIILKAEILVLTKLYNLLVKKIKVETSTASTGKSKATTCKIVKEANITDIN